MSISIIIPAWNSAATLPLTLRSVKTQTLRDFEVIVADDASTDSTAAVAERELAGVPHKIIRLPENRGPAAARNAAIAAADGDWLAFLDGDDLWPTYKLEFQLARMQEHPDAVMSCGFAPSFSTDADIPTLEYPAETVKERTIQVNAFEETNPVATSSAVLSKDVFQAVGGFDESFRGPEDMDLWMRIVAGYKVMLFSTPLALYRERPGSLCMTDAFLKEVLRVYDKAFAEGGALHHKRFLKRRTIATRYTSAAWSAINAGNRVKALQYLIKSWIIHPGKIVQEMRYPYWRLKILRKVIREAYTSGLA